MRYYACLLLSLIAAFSGPEIYAQFYSSEQALKKDWPELVPVSGFWGNSYSTYRYYVGDINGDKLPDIISFVKTYVARKPEDEKVIAMEISLSRGRELFKRITVPKLFPCYDCYQDEPGYLYIADVRPEAGGFMIQVKDRDRPGYFRNVSITYDRKDNQLKITKDGGKGVLSGITEEAYVTAADFGELDITAFDNWDYIDEYIPKFAKQGGRKRITVKNRDEFFAALGDHRDIVLDMDVLDLSMKNLTPYMKDIKYETGVDNSGILSYYTDLTITGKQHVDVIVENDVDDVLRMDGCKLIKLEHLNFYHLVPAGAYCAGIVVQFSNSRHITMRDCQFNGSGMVGITLNDSRYVAIEDCKIYNNSSEAVSFYGSDNVLLANTEIYKNNCASDLLALRASEVTFRDCNIHDNVTRERMISPPSGDGRGRVAFSNVRFRNNEEKNESGRYFYFPGDDEESSFILDKDFYEQGGEAATVDMAVAAADAAAAAAAVVADAATAAPADDAVTVSADDRSAVRESLLRNFIAAEDSRDINAVLVFLSPAMTRYWEKEYPGRDYLRKTYAASWKTLKSSSNTILGIKMLSEDEYVLHTYFDYTVAQTGKKGSRESYVVFVFDENNKIISIKETVKPR